MGEVIHWQTLTPEQRDALVAEKVMQWEPKVCEGSISWDHGIWRCLECGTDGTRHEDTAHNIPVPRYTQSLDAAWLIVQHFTVGIDLHSIPGSTVSCRISGIIGEPSFGVSHSPAEAICKAALEACGVQVVP